MLHLLHNCWNCNAQQLLAKLPSESIDAVITDPMYMVAAKKGKSTFYDWGHEPGTGEAHEFWDYHGDIYNECRRVLKPGGTLAWAMGCKHYDYFPQWFGGFRIWSTVRFFTRSMRSQNAFAHIWMVQTKEKRPIEFPQEDGVIFVAHRRWKKQHPCPKTEEEMAFMIKHLTSLGDVVLDVFAGTGTTLVQCEKLGRRWLGCDLSPNYCQVALKRIRQYQKIKNRKVCV